MNSLFRLWSQSAENFANSFLQANRLALASLGLSPPESGGSPRSVPRDVERKRNDWEFDTTIDTRESISVGDSIEFTKTLDDEDVRRFAVASGDTNPLHLAPEYARRTRFNQRIVHGTLVSGLISAALARMPGEIIYLSHNTKFLRPVTIGETLTARCEITEDLGENQYRLNATVVNEDGQNVAEGEDIVLVDEVDSTQVAQRQKWLHTSSFFE